MAGVRRGHENRIYFGRSAKLFGRIKSKRNIETTSRFLSLADISRIFIGDIEKFASGIYRREYWPRTCGERRLRRCKLSGYASSGIQRKCRHVVAAQIGNVKKLAS